MNTARKNFLGILFSLLSVLAFSMEWWFTRELEAFHLTGFLLVCLLFCVGTLVMLFGLFKKENRESFPKSGIQNLLLFGIIDVFAFGFFFLAIIDISVVKTLLWLNMSVFYVLLLSPFFGEIITIRKIIAGILGFLGMGTYLILGENSENIFEFSRGDLYGFLCGVAMTGFFFLGNKSKKAPLYWKLIFTWVSGLVLFPVLYFVFNESFVLRSFLSLEFSILFFGILITSLFLAMIFYQFSIQYIEASKVVTVRMTEPVFQGITAYLIVNETLNLYQGLGVVLLVWGIFLIRK